MFKTIAEKFKLLKLGCKKTFAGQVMLLASSAIALGLAAIIIAVTAKANEGLRSGMNSSATVYDTNLNGTYGLSKLGENFGTIGTVVGIAVVILILMAAFGGFLTGKRGGAGPGKARGKARGRRRR